MDDTLRILRAWLTFAGCVLIILILSWARAVLMPIALAILLTFVLTPPVAWLQRWIGRVPAVLTVVALVFTAFGLAGWGLTQRLDDLAKDLPRYQTNVLAKIADVRGAGKGGTVQQFQEALADIKTDLEKSDGIKGKPPAPVVVTSPQATGVPGLTWLNPIVGPLGTAGLVVTMVIFMLLERHDLRERLIGLFHPTRLKVTSTALDEAGALVSRQLLMQTIVSLVYGIVAGTGLYLVGVPYPFVWAVLGAALRFVPYIGPVIGAGAPILVSLAATDGWAGPLWVVAGFVLLELVTNLVLEPVLYAGATGISPVALLAAVAFWTWLWGPIGLLIATPLTICVVVIGKHVPGLEFVGMLMATVSTPAPAPASIQADPLLADDLMGREA
jgi:predicted PurR-regulated permease PerM